MHRNERSTTNRCDNTPRNVLAVTGSALEIMKSTSSSPTRAIERFRDNTNRAIRLLSGFH